MIMRAALAGTLLLALPSVAASQPDALDYGPHRVGFRTVREVDRSRTVRASTTFDGQPIDGDPAMTLAIAMWYPAQPRPGSAPMTTADYQRESRVPGRERAAMVADWQRMLGFAGLTVTEADVLRALDMPRRAVRDAAPLDGRFPVVLGGMESASNSSALGEYLASHGYVVITAPSSMRTGTQQASAPLLALETQTRNLEYLLAFAHGLTNADVARLGVVGVNFDGMAALTFEMRNMRVSAVVSVDGWEGKAGGGATLRESPYFDPVRVRVPYLVFEQDEPSVSPGLAHDRAVWNALRYSDRQWYVLRNFGHLFLTSDQLVAPGLPPAAAEGYTFLYGTIRDFLDTHVRKSPSARGARPAAIVKEQDHASAISPAPTGEEFEQLVMTGPIGRAAEVFRRALADNPGHPVADEGTLGLYAFRFGQQKKAPEVLALRELAAEAFPASARAAYNLGLAREATGDTSGARSAFERALTLLEADADLPAPERERLRGDLRRRLQRLDT